jgi:hypothetical protein
MKSGGYFNFYLSLWRGLGRDIAAFEARFEEIIASDRARFALNLPGAESCRRTRLHTAMDIAVRRTVTELAPALVVTSSHDACPHDHGFSLSVRHPEAINHHADACVRDTATGETYLIDFTFVNPAKATDTNGAKPGSHADDEEEPHCWPPARRPQGLRASAQWHY